MGDSDFAETEKSDSVQMTNSVSKIELLTPDLIDLDGTNETAEFRGWRRFLGMLLALIASLVFSFNTLFVKILHDYGFHGNSLMFWCYLGITILSIPVFFFCEFNAKRRSQTSVLVGIWPLTKDGNWRTAVGLVVRGIVGGTAMVLRYYALQYLPIGDTIVISNSTPILVTILAHFTLGERLGMVPILLTITTLGGVILISHPPFITGDDHYEPGTLIGIALACGALVFGSFMFIITRKIRHVHFSVMIPIFGLVGVIQGYGLAQSFNDVEYPRCLSASLLIVGLAILCFVAQIAIILAVQYEQAGPVSLVRSTEVIFGFLIQYAFLGEIPRSYSAVGGFIVIFGVALTGLRKYIAALPQDDPTRKFFHLILR